MMALEDRRLLATFTVESTADTLTAGVPTQGTLRWAIDQANATAGDNTIQFDSSAFSMPQTILLTQGQLELSQAGTTETVTGPSTGVTVNGGGASRAFQVDSGVTAVLSGLTITKGTASAFGGALLNDGTAELTDCAILGNTAPRGGGIDNDPAANLTLTDCTLSGNSADYGGGLENFGTATLIACTLSGNTGGGGLDNQGTATLTDTLVAGNTSAAGATDILGPDSVSGSYDLTGTGGSGGLSAGNHNQLDVANPGLGPLGSYGGPTLTFPLLPGSPASHAGTAASGVTTDQRGFPLDNPVDIGAFQSQPGSLVVNTTGDALGAPLGDLSLRQAVNLANVFNGGQTINFDQTVFGSTQTIDLTQGQLELSGTGGDTITGPQKGVVVSGNGLSRVFQFDGTMSARMSDLTITGGKASAPGGGGLLSGGPVDLTNCTIAGNTTNGDGGGLLCSGSTVTLTNCTIAGNSAGGDGGGLLCNGSSPSLTLTACTVSSNSAGGDGGGLINPGRLDARDSTFGNNSAADAGALDNPGTANLTDCTVTGNSASQAGGLVSSGTMTLTSCTVTGNASSTSQPGGLEADGSVTLTDTIVAGNTTSGSPGDIGGSMGVSGGSNLIGTGGSGGLTPDNHNLLNVDNPVLGSLGNYGGPTPTIPVLPGSPALNAGTAGDGFPGTDQRGKGPVGAPDIGAFQSQKFTMATAAGSTPQKTQLGTAFANPVAVIFTPNNPAEPVAGGLVTFAVSASSDGATATLSPAGPVTIGGDGSASVTATANTVLGQYGVTASTVGTNPTSVSFVLSNVLQPVFSAIASPTISYGTPDVILSGTILAGSEVPPGDVAIALNGTVQQAAIQADGTFASQFYSGSLDVRESPFLISYSYAANEFFQPATAQTNLTVTAATPPISWPSPAGIDYGTPLSFVQLDASSPVPGSFTYTPPAGTLLQAGYGRVLSATFLPQNPNNYVSVNVTTTINVAPATPTITWAQPASITYGTALSAAQLDATATWAVDYVEGNVAGTFRYAPAAGKVLPAGDNQMLAVTFTPSDLLDYTKAAGTTKIDVVPAIPAITWTNPAAIVYGTALSAAQLDATADVPGTFNYSPPSGTVLRAGSGQTLSATFKPTDTADYATEVAKVTIDVNPATPAITWASPAAIVYGTALSAAQLDATAKLLGTFTYTPAAGTVLHAGNDQLSVLFTPADATDYASTLATTTIPVLAAATTTGVSISVDRAVAGQPVTFTATVSTAGPGSAPPSGSVTFLDGTTVLGTAPLDGSGQAVLTRSDLSVAAHAITAVYDGNANSPAVHGGDVDFQTSRSDSVGLTVAMDPTQIVLVPRPGRNSRRKAVATSLTIAIEPMAPGGGLPTGTLTYLIRKKRLGSVRISGGTATLPAKSGSLLNKVITFDYGGDADYLPSTLTLKLTSKLLKAMSRPLVGVLGTL
jgi:hypothetical protein